MPRPRIPHLAVSALLALALLGSGLGATAQASGGSVLGWGENDYGQIGNGTLGGGACGCLPSATPVTGVATATQVAAGSLHTLALLADGTVDSWGGNPYGELGNGSPTLKGTLRTGPRTRKIGGTGTQTPLPVTGLSNVVAVAAGSNHGLALLANGTVMAWGMNDNGTLGIGNATGPETCESRACARAPVPVPGLSNVIAISAYGELNLALLANGTVMAWGNAASGQMGDETSVDEGCFCVDHPVPVPGVTGAVAVAAGGEAAAALLADGTVRTWGGNTSGELGDGNTIVSGPECRCRGAGPVSGLPPAKGVTMGSSAGYAVRQAGGGMSWGFNEVGELGNGTLGSGECECVPVPAPISAPLDLQSIEVSNVHGLGLLSNGTVTSWGVNLVGQRGDGTTGPGNGIPAGVPGVAGASGIAAGSATSFAIVGPSQTLDVALAGAGTGSVGTAGLVCPGACSARYPQSQVETLRAEPAAGNGFAGFSGPCSGTGTCRVTMDGDQHVTATFGVPKGTAITKSDVDSRRKKATFTFSAPGAITGYECKLIKPAKKKKGKGKKHGRIELGKKGAKKPKAKPPAFAPCTGPATYKGLKPGKYSFEVRALDILGADATPASQKFQIKKPKKKKRHRR